MTEIKKPYPKCYTGNTIIKGKLYTFYLYLIMFCPLIPNKNTKFMYCQLH